MKKLILLILPLLLLSACATTSPSITTGKSLLAIQSEIVTVREAIGVPCQKGMIAQVDCQNIDSWYQQAKPAYDAAVDATVIAITTGSENDIKTYDVKKAALVSLLTNMTQIATKYGVKAAK